MKAALTLILMAFAGSAAAHTGHIADAAGHDHWIAGAALGLALGLSAWAAIKSWKDADKQTAEEEAEETKESEGETA